MKTRSNCIRSTSHQKHLTFFHPKWANEAHIRRIHQPTQTSFTDKKRKTILNNNNNNDNDKIKKRNATRHEGVKEEEERTQGGAEIEI